ncbi:MAG: N-acyl homoserine lactone hydrolase [Pseudomonadota bacterium]|nr:N-acyl homoserine lactone hydrolase [Pseudomonadota bacterium]
MKSDSLYIWIIIRRIVFFLLVCFGIYFLVNIYQKPKQKTPDINLYTLNCGYIDINDGYYFSDTGFYPHKPIYLADPCFLIKHPNGWLLWDTGLGDQYLGHKFKDTKHSVTLDVPLSLSAQLKQFGITADNIKYVGLSHTHFDHTGNVNLFQNSTWILQRTEYQSLQGEITNAQDKSIISILQSAKTNKILLDGDYDVFGDGSIIVLRTPGHTVGHQSLQINLLNSGVLILSGDLYHTRKAYQFKQIPAFNNSRADTIASMSRIDDILQNTNGRLIIQHDMNDFNELPKYPKYLN